VLAIGEVDTSEGFPLLRAEGIWRLEDIENQSRRVARVRLDLTGADKAALRHIAAAAQLFPGESRLELEGYAGSRGITYRLLARRQIFFCSPFYQALARVLPPESIELFDQRGQPLAIALSEARAQQEPGPEPAVPYPPLAEFG
jgi:hypothetical protein